MIYLAMYIVSTIIVVAAVVFTCYLGLMGLVWFASLFRSDPPPNRTYEPQVFHEFRPPVSGAKQTHSGPKDL